MSGILNVLLAVSGVAASAPEGAVRVIAMDSFHGASVRRAVEGALRRLDSAECRTVFTDFRDAAGRPLQDRLRAYGVTAADYLRWIVFTDGSGHRSCAGGSTLAVTAPGSRVVYVCGRLFFKTQLRDPAFVQAAVIHEMLHTLGLGENPPSSDQITRQVESRCGRWPPPRPPRRVVWIPWGMSPLAPKE